MIEEQAPRHEPVTHAGRRGPGETRGTVDKTRGRLKPRDLRPKGTAQGEPLSRVIDERSSRGACTIFATADLHGNLPEIPECDILLIAGDVCPLDNHDPGYQLAWLDTNFRAWLLKVPARHIVGVAGNHDFIFEHPDRVDALFLPWLYLRDSSTLVEGLHIYGLPWVPELKSWAFYANKEMLELHHRSIPKGVDIVLSHGPPRGFGDRLIGGRNCGAKPALDMLHRVKPKAFVCGHVHEGFGYYWYGDTDIWNVAYVDEFYTPRRQIIQIDSLTDNGFEDQDQASEEREVCNPHADARSPHQPVTGPES